MIDFLLLYENKSREMEGLCLLKMELEKRGYYVVLDQVQYFYKKRYKVKVVVVPFLYNNNDIYRYIYCICGKVNKILNLRWEQIYSRKMEENLASFFYPKGEAKKVIQLCWGEAEADKLLKLGVRKELIFITGPIHLDLITKPGYFEKREYLQKKYRLAENKKWILFISSFSNATFTEKEKIEAMKMLGKERVDFIDLSIKSKKEILEWFKQIIKEKNDQYEIIYRPHPSEKKDDILRNLEAKNKGFHIITDDSVGQWIACSDFVLNWYSTSAIQSQLLKKGNAILRPIPISYEMDLEIFSDATVIDSYKGLVEYLSSKADALMDNFVFNKYYFFDSTYAYQRIANICQEVLNNNALSKIRYNTILHETSWFERLKFEILYKLYVPLLRFLKNKKLSTLFSGSVSYDMVSRNTVAESELSSIKKRLSKILGKGE
ncbi:hypothetical protein D7V86_20900 [bacterium D16-51]|nr:hypothetical protein D7V96_22255 [bacterium D16-59]RKI55881.1 hypothetical protein D7V86_20900 [bacterium D16-51]